MTEETLNRANDITRCIKWADKIMYHISNRNRLSFRFDTTRDCMESHDTESCPQWLVDVIENAIENKRQKWIKEFESI